MIAPAETVAQTTRVFLQLTPFEATLLGVVIAIVSVLLTIILSRIWWMSRNECNGYRSSCASQAKLVREHTINTISELKRSLKDLGDKFDQLSTTILKYVTKDEK